MARMSSHVGIHLFEHLTSTHDEEDGWPSRMNHLKQATRWMLQFMTGQEQFPYPYVFI